MAEITKDTKVTLTLQGWLGMITVISSFWIGYGKMNQNSNDRFDAVTANQIAIYKSLVSKVDTIANKLDKNDALQRQKNIEYDSKFQGQVDINRQTDAKIDRLDNKIDRYRYGVLWDSLRFESFVKARQ